MSTTVKETGLTPEEAGLLIGCSAYTVKYMARNKEIPYYKVGTKYKFTRAALLRWMEQQEHDNYKF